MAPSRISLMQQLAILKQSGGQSMENMNASDEEWFIIEPLTTAKLEEPVICTPKKILYHPAYSGGWKVLRRFRPDGSGRADSTYIHKTHGRFRSKKKVLNLLNSLLEKEKESADPAKQQGSGASQQAHGIGGSSSATPLAEGKPSSVTNNQSAEGSGAASASN